MSKYATPHARQPIPAGTRYTPGLSNTYQQHPEGTFSMTEEEREALAKRNNTNKEK